jgi:hypothetical protein
VRKICKKSDGALHSFEKFRDFPPPPPPPLSRPALVILTPPAPVSLPAPVVSTHLTPSHPAISSPSLLSAIVACGFVIVASWSCVVFAGVGVRALEMARGAMQRRGIRHALMLSDTHTPHTTMTG